MSEHVHTARSVRVRRPLSELPNLANSQRPPQREILIGKSKKAAVFAPQPSAASTKLDESLNAHRRDTAGSNPAGRDNSVKMRPEACPRFANSTPSTTVPVTKRKTHIGPWQLGKTIGTGGCSRVRAVRHRYNGELAAVKIVDRSTAEYTRAESLANLVESAKGSAFTSCQTELPPIPVGLQREIALMKLFDHPNIVQLFDVWENRNELYLVMELVSGGDLFRFISHRRALPEHEAVYIFRQIISALLYCHRLQICHRDLKPENILLDDEHFTVKLIDFGMAALQQEGQRLTTACGSPHYAAPEVVSHKPYDGRQADVWSCGVILFVMLAGRTPFNFPAGKDTKYMFRDIVQAKYHMPEYLSREAQDLIRRIFVTSPQERITMEGIWNHPLLHKYDDIFGFDDDAARQAADNQIARLNSWKIKSARDIHKEILHNMQTVWHSVPEQVLVERLISDEHNHEKLFYAALIKHYQESMESLGDDRNDVKHRASDRHHSRYPKTLGVLSSGLDKVSRTRSQYSIMNDEHLRQSPAVVGSSGTTQSQDRHRSSKERAVNAGKDNFNKNIHRQNTSQIRQSSIASSSNRRPNASRLETLKRGRRGSTLSRASIGRSLRSTSTLPRRSLSGYTMTSSQWPSSPPIIATMRPSDLRKRGVSFNHLRRGSSHLRPASSAYHSPQFPGHACSGLDDIFPEDAYPFVHEGNSSPCDRAKMTIRSRKETAITNDNSNTSVEPRIQHMRTEIRKHSVDLARACEEAFFHSSEHSEASADRRPIDTAQFRDKTQTAEEQETRISKITKPSMPAESLETPNTYLSKTIHETRQKLATYRGIPDESSKKFEEVMKMLENIMPTDPPAQAAPSRRAVSAPTTTILGRSRDLPEITEETARPSRDQHGIPEDAAKPTREQKRRVATVRMVMPSSPGPVAPLSIRKHGDLIRDRSRSMFDAAASREQLDAAQASTGTRGGKSVGRKAPTASAYTDKVDRDETESNPSHGSRVPSRVVSLQSDEQRGEGIPETSSQSAQGPRPDSALAGTVENSQDSALPKARLSAARSGLARWFTKMRGDRREKSNIRSDSVAHTEPSLISMFSTPSSFDASQSAGPERSWFSRFFRIKPVVDVLCFNEPRARVRQELVILLKEWRRHGVRDLQHSRETNIISMRVDKNNSLEIKPVTLSIELFVVLENGRKVGLSIARFTQIKGAASSFRRVLEVIDGVMRGRGWLIEDEEKRRALCEVVRG